MALRAEATSRPALKEVGRLVTLDPIAWAAALPGEAEPDVDVALDPEYGMAECEVPGRQIGSLHAADVNAALDRLDS
jgi:hypothetical protein